MSANGSILPQAMAETISPASPSSANSTPTPHPLPKPALPSSPNASPPTSAAIHVGETPTLRVKNSSLTWHDNCYDDGAVTSSKPDRPYFEAWLRRTGRQLAISGRLTQTATVLAKENGGTPEEWRSRLRTLLEGDEVPSLDLLMRIDGLLAGAFVKRADDSAQGVLFE
jgi:hypothetical protein